MGVSGINWDFIDSLSIPLSPSMREPKVVNPVPDRGVETEPLKQVEERHD